MATTLATLVPDLCGRLEELPPGDGTGPVFWSETYEMLPALVDAQFEAAILTGAIQAINIPVTLTANQTFFSLQNNMSIGIPAGVIAAIRLRAPYSIRKTTLKGLSDVIPNWEVTTSGSPGAPTSQLRAWAPLGISKFLIFPQLIAAQEVVMDFIVSPVVAARPYTSSIGVPFLAEYFDAFSEYAAVMLRAKELGSESEESSTVMNQYLQQMKQLSLWQNRLDSLILSQTYGAKAGVQRREIV